ncbi:hypothetical protein M0802_009920 [Mischocyttarus mexicanus]|nr:hypothetical protein M0802_009920 [Mischocyttarus mexicanus]
MFQYPSDTAARMVLAELLPRYTSVRYCSIPEIPRGFTVPQRFEIFGYLLQNLVKQTKRERKRKRDRVRENSGSILKDHLEYVLEIPKLAVD